MQPEQYTLALLRLNGGPFRAASRIDNGDGKSVTPGWPRVMDSGRHYHLRTVLTCETVYDVGDNTEWPITIRDATAIHEALVHLQVPHQVSLSGGRGIHIHVFHSPSAHAEDDVRWRVAMLVLEYARMLSGIDDLECDYRLISPTADSRLVREHGAKKKPSSTHRKTLWCDWPAEAWLPFPGDIDSAYAVMSRRLRPPVPSDTSHLDLGWTSCVGASACPKRPSCLTEFLGCPDCPVGA